MNENIFKTRRNGAFFEVDYTDYILHICENCMEKFYKEKNPLNLTKLNKRHVFCDCAI